MIDYNVASKSYDNTRNASGDLVALFHDTISFSTATTVLDFGCGTGNYLNIIQTSYGCKCYGVEPSEGMRAKAKIKNPELTVEQGDHAQIPYPDDFFDFAYMTDVIHHVPDLEQMFQTLKRVLKPRGKLCIVTQSHEQIENRFFNHYFPSLAAIEKRRYPRIEDIERSAIQAGFELRSIGLRAYSKTDSVTASLIKTVEEKNFSMFKLLSPAEHATGLEQMKNDLGKVYETEGAGDSLIWLEKHR